MPGVTVTFVEPVIELVTVSLPETDCKPAVTKVKPVVKVCVPLSVELKVKSGVGGVTTVTVVEAVLGWKFASPLYWKMIT